MQVFWLLSQNADTNPAGQSDAAAWDADIGFGTNSATLVDGAQDGFQALFPDRPGTDGSMVFTYGTIITSIDTKNPESDVADAL